MLAEVSTRKLRALVTAEALDVLTGGNEGTFVEQREGSTEQVLSFMSTTSFHLVC